MLDIQYTRYDATRTRKIYVQYQDFFDETAMQCTSAFESTRATILLQRSLVLRRQKTTLLCAQLISKPFAEGITSSSWSSVAIPVSGLDFIRRDRLGVGIQRAVASASFLATSGSMPCPARRMRRHLSSRRFATRSMSA